MSFRTLQQQEKSNRGVTAPSPQIRTAAVSLSKGPGAFLQRKSNCACGGDCPSCQQSALPISQPRDAADIEAENIANKVMRMSDSDSRGAHLDHSVQSFMQS